MNNTEKRYAALLDARVASGEVLWWMFEAMKLYLTVDDKLTGYTPDFTVMLSDCTLEIHETKGGFTREDAWIKLKVAASTFPLVFRKCVWDKGKWTITEVGRVAPTPKPEPWKEHRESVPLKFERKPQSVPVPVAKPAPKRELVAYLDGKPISYEEARKMIGK